MCVCKLCVDKLCVSKLLCATGAGGGGGGRDAEPKTRTPHKDVGKKTSDKGQTSAYNCLQLIERSACESVVHLQFKQHARIPLLPGLNVDVCCSGAPRTTEEAPANPAVATPMNCTSERIDNTTRKRTLCTMFELDIHAITCESHNSS